MRLKQEQESAKNTGTVKPVLSGHSKEYQYWLSRPIIA